MPQDLTSYSHAMAIDPVTGKPMPKTATSMMGSFIRLSTEPMPTVDDGVKDGDDLILVDTKAVYIYYKGTWYQQ